jgi:hypothetical protein
MKHRWKRAALALLLAGLFCVLLTACELEEEEVTITSWANLSGIASDTSASTSWETDSAGAYWTVERTRTDTYVDTYLNKHNYCLYQIETVSRRSDDEVQSVSLQYVLKSSVYWNVLGDDVSELGKENSLEKLSDTTDRRYVVITYDYESSGEETWPTKVTLRYGTETSKDQTPKGVIYETTYSLYDEVTKDKSVFDYVSGVGLGTVTTYNDISYSNTAFLNTALKIILDQADTTNTVDVCQNYIRNLASNALSTATELLHNTRNARLASATAANSTTTTTTTTTKTS